MSSSLLTKMVGLESSAAIWCRLLTHFALHTRAMVKKFHLLLKTPKNDRSITTYVTDIKKIVDLLAAVGSLMSTADHVEAILDGLYADYDGFITSILSRQDLYTVYNLEALLLVQEEQFERHKLAHDSILQVNNVSSSWNLKNQHKKKPSTYPFHGGRSQHPTDFRTPSLRPHVCSLLHHDASWNSTKPICQICHKTGHTADTCWHRYDPPPTHSYNANISHYTSSMDSDSTSSILGAPSTIEDPLWYPDTGATHHITKDSKFFTHKQPYHGNMISNSATDKVHLFLTLILLFILTPILTPCSNSIICCMCLPSLKTNQCCSIC